MSGTSSIIDIKIDVARAARIFRTSSTIKNQTYKFACNRLYPGTTGTATTYLLEVGDQAEREMYQNRFIDISF
jgi:hypothetical protein